MLLTFYLFHWTGDRSDIKDLRECSKIVSKYICLPCFVFFLASLLSTICTDDELFWSCIRFGSSLIFIQVDKSWSTQHYILWFRSDIVNFDINKNSTKHCTTNNVNVGTTINVDNSNDLLYNATDFEAAFTPTLEIDAWWTNHLSFTVISGVRWRHGEETSLSNLTDRHSLRW